MSEREVSRGQGDIVSVSPTKWENLPLHAGSENKVEKCGTFFNFQKETVKTPRQPHNSPYCHHNFTIAKHPKNQKSPYKTTSSPQIFFF
jgi:hypothetical protein